MLVGFPPAAQARLRISFATARTSYPKGSYPLAFHIPRSAVLQSVVSEASDRSISSSATSLSSLNSRRSFSDRFLAIVICPPFGGRRFACANDSTDQIPHEPFNLRLCMND